MRETIFAMSIAGSDSGGGAGIQADLKTFSALGVFGTSVITAVTAQNTTGVRGIQAIKSNMIASQIDAVLEDFDIAAIKIGMIFTKDNVIAIKERLIANRFAGKLILDPVMVSTQGNKLILSDATDAICEHLFPISDIITPNVDEAEAILDMKIFNVEDMMVAAHKLMDKYRLKAVLIKGGHLKEEEITDVFISQEEELFVKTNKICTRNTHGTGCTLSSAIAAYCARGEDIKTAYQSAKTFLTQAITSAVDIDLGHGHGSVNHFFNPIELITK
ncbi:MAG: bifunctional hydroxymethylpyrimidine kinase/phosphomethylpyrimidine kinase [Bacteroidales bacterium]|jgi:hydroxymethylpyrimidine/phosphomethylpyrimidine kinase|nr:bifunctional hydroxymethylpyrimidine kinase/phosphomethylpyrimidine kinase [Bacteroidales bacterium]